MVGKGEHLFGVPCGDVGGVENEPEEFWPVRPETRSSCRRWESASPVVVGRDVLQDRWRDSRKDEVEQAVSGGAAQRPGEHGSGRRGDAWKELVPGVATLVPLRLRELIGLVGVVPGAGAPGATINRLTNDYVYRWVNGTHLKVR